MPRNRVLLLLALLAVAVGWIVLRGRLGGDAPGPGAAAGAADGAGPSERAPDRKGKGTITAESVPVVVTGLAHRRTSETFTRERSLFEFARSPEEIKAEEDRRKADALAARLRAEEASRQAAEQAKRDAERMAAEAKLKEEQRKQQEAWLKEHPPKPVPPSFPYQYVGTIGPADDPFAILTGSDRGFRYARVGEVIDDKFKLEYIAEARLDLSFTDTRFSDQFAQVQRNFDTSARPR